jgi:hypothetical protein
MPQFLTPPLFSFETHIEIYKGGWERVIFELFMCKVLGLRFFNYKVMIYFMIFFGFGLKLETN